MGSTQNKLAGEWLEDLNGLSTTFYFEPNPDGNLDTLLKLKQDSCEELVVPAEKFIKIFK